MGDLSIHFSKKEFRCRGSDCGISGDNCGFDDVNSELIAVLEDLRAFCGGPLDISSGCRCKTYNESEDVGGGTHSQHLLGKAADVSSKNATPNAIHAYLRVRYPDKYGIGKYNGFTHIDVRTKRARW